MVVRSISSHMIEEAIPAYASETSKLAPQETYKPAKGPTMGKMEMTKTDRNRLRRSIKLSRKAYRKQKDEQVRTLARLDPRKQTMLDKKDALKTLSQNKNVTILPQARKGNKLKK